MNDELQSASSGPAPETSCASEQDKITEKIEKSTVATDSEGAVADELDPEESDVDETDEQEAAEQEAAEQGADEQEAAAESAEPKTALQKLVALGDKVCSLLTRPRDLMNSGVAGQTRSLAAAFKPMPAATVGSLAVGLPHAHTAHPPFVPLVPLGPAILGFSNDVLINGLPALLNGALGASPTCCGLTPFYEVCTGSSKVLIGGERAVRVLDLTAHCASAAPKAPKETVAMRRLRRTLLGAEHALHVARKAEDAADFGVQRAEAVQAVQEAAASSSPALHEAADQSLAMAATSPLAEAAQEQLSEALLKLMGSDPATPMGTPGVIATGSANVLIGGFPMPGGSAVVRGLLRLLP